MAAYQARTSDGNFVNFHDARNLEQLGDVLNDKGRVIVTVEFAGGNNDIRKGQTILFRDTICGINVIG